MLYLNREENILNNDGVFSYARRKNIQVSITSPDWYKVNEESTYCQIKGVSHPIQCIIDGTNSTAWRNLNESNGYFLLDFQFSSLYLTSYSLINNDNSEWKLVDTQNEASPDGHFFKHFEVDNPGNFRYFNFSTNYGLIHLTQIEFFGILKYGLHTCHSNILPKISNTMVFILFLIK